MKSVSSAKILVVEDNRTQAEYLKHFLEKAGDQVILASNGIEALEQIHLDLPDIIMTDVMMPLMDGYELCRLVKGDTKTSDIPVILVTYLYNAIDVIKGLESGADSFIIKPYDPDCIHACINSILQGKQHVDEDVDREPIVIPHSGKTYSISSSRNQILNVLLSTYEIAIKKNNELQVAHERLHYLNAQLRKAVTDLERMNEETILENTECIRLKEEIVVLKGRLNKSKNECRPEVYEHLKRVDTLLSGISLSQHQGQDITEAAELIKSILGDITVIGYDE